MFDREKFITSLDHLNNTICTITFQELQALIDFAKQGESELEYILACAFDLGCERASILLKEEAYPLCSA